MSVYHRSKIPQDGRPKVAGSDGTPTEPEQPFTRVPNSLIDEWLPHLSGAECKVALYLTRKIAGWHKQTDQVGLREISKGTGLSLCTASVAAESLEKHGLASRDRHGNRGRTIWKLNFQTVPVFGKSEHCDQSVLSSQCSENPYSTVRKISTVLFGKSEHSKEIIIKEKKQKKKASPREEANAPESARITSSLRLDDDEKTAPPAKREPGATPREEFLLRIHERHGVAVDAEKCLEGIKAELEKGNVPFSDYLETDSKATTAPRRLTNPHGHYIRLAQRMVRDAKAATLEATLQMSSTLTAIINATPQETPRCTKCAGTGRLSEEKYCECPMARDLERSERKARLAKSEAA